VQPHSMRFMRKLLPRSSLIIQHHFELRPVTPTQSQQGPLDVLAHGNLRQDVRHSHIQQGALGTAVLAQQLAMELCPKTHQQAYLTGLLHDIGILIFPRGLPRRPRTSHSISLSSKPRNLASWVSPRRSAAASLRNSGAPPVEISDAIEFHNRPGLQHLPSSDALPVQRADNFCFRNGLGYGYALEINNLEQIADL
jgi:HD-like signal output (HDOD) protein